MHRRQRTIVVTALVLGLPPVLLAGAWRMAGVSAVEDDLLYYFPQRAFFGAAVRAGELPLWNPHVALGYPSAADPQVGTWYPGTYLFAVLPAVWAYPATICLHFALAGFGAYRLLRWMGRDWRAALFGAVAFEFCGFLVAHRAHLTMHHAAAWLPVIVWCWGRYMRTHKPAHFAAAVLSLGLQLLVQHIQVSIMTGLLVVAYVAWLTRGQWGRAAWRVAAGMLLAAGVAAIQILPTLHFYRQCTRSEPLYERFTENSFEWTSLALWVFPMLYGSRTPNFYAQEWWGRSHLCEQAAYASLPVLLLAVAGLALWKRDRHTKFWAGVGLVCLALAFGKYNPLTFVLFHVPILTPLRVPARWLLLVNLALVVLGTACLDALLRRDAASASARRSLARVIRHGMPAVLVLAAVLMLWMRWAHRADASEYGRAVAASLSITNVAVLVPLLLAGLSAALLWRFTRNEAAWTRIVPALLVLTIADLASFASFNDIDTRRYADVSVLRTPAPGGLAHWLAAHRDGGAQRLWIPREWADYREPLESLWPMSNMLFGVDTLHNYTPLVRLDQRLLFGFRAWGASETALTLLRNPGLLEALSVRWVAARTNEEKRLLACAGGPDDASDWPQIGNESGASPRLRVSSGVDAVWPVAVPEPGVYGVEFAARLVQPRGAWRWFVALESADGTEVVSEIVREPVDLAGGERRVRCYFRCDSAIGAARVRVYTYFGPGLEVAAPTFARVADLDESPAPYTKRTVTADGTVIYELTGSRPGAYLVDEVIPVESSADALRWLTSEAGAAGLPGRAVVEGFRPENVRYTGGEVRVVAETDRDLAFEVAAPQGGFLVIANAFDAGWTARLDGEPATLYRTNGVVQGLAVPAGSHRVRLRYRPPGLTTGATVTGLSVVLLLLTNARRRNKRAANTISP